MHNHQLIVSVDVLGEPPALSEEYAVLLFQSVRELLFHAAKYAESGYAAVRLRVENNVLRIEVRDNGKGFDMERIGKEVPTALSSKF